jgi:hypothetical protein
MASNRLAPQKEGSIRSRLGSLFLPYEEVCPYGRESKGMPAGPRNERETVELPPRSPLHPIALSLSFSPFSPDGDEAVQCRGRGFTTFH